MRALSQRKLETGLGRRTGALDTIGIPRILGNRVRERTAGPPPNEGSDGIPFVGTRHIADDAPAGPEGRTPSRLIGTDIAYSYKMQSLTIDSL